jgi:hypothetical protein
MKDTSEDDEESVLDRIKREMEERRYARGNDTSDAVNTESMQIPSWEGAIPDGELVESLRIYIHFLATAPDVDTYIERLYAMAERLLEEGTKLKARGRINFYESFDIH